MLELLNTPKWIANIGDRTVYDLKAAKKYIAEKITPDFERLGYCSFTVILKSDGTKIGSCGLYDRKGLKGVDIGFAFLPAFEKKGYAYESASRLMKAAKEDFKMTTLNAITIIENKDSQRLLEKLGLTFQKMISLPDDPVELMFYSVAL